MTLTYRVQLTCAPQVDMDCANMNFDNTIFAFTKIMWLSNPTQTLSALVADWPCRAVLTEFVKTCSVVFEGHFEFYVQVITYRPDHTMCPNGVLTTYLCCVPQIFLQKSHKL